MSVKIDKKLNLVLSLDRDDQQIYVHSTPISRELFNIYFKVIAKSFTEMYQVGVMAAPRIAALTIRQVASDQGMDEGPTGIQGLFNELERLTNLLVPGPNGWETLPLSMAKARKLINEDEYDEVINAISFFIVCSAMHKRDQIASILSLMNSLWGSQSTLLNSMEYSASLAASIVTTTSQPVVVSSVPS
jgi:hypothetical protein